MKRLLPLTGVVAVALVFASFAAAGTAPAADASMDKVAAFYADHHRGQVVSAVLLSLGALLLLVFMTTLGEALRPAATSRLCLAGGVVLVVGLTLFAGLTMALGDVQGEVEPATLQGLHVLNQELFFTVTIGSAAFLLGAGAAVLSTRVLPSWLGWSAVVSGVVAAVPSHVLGGALDHIGFFGFIGLAVWTLVVSILLLRREAT